MSQHNIRLKDIADKLGISIPSVSRALNDKTDISQETKDKVNELAKELHYQKNQSAVNFKNQESLLIGVIIPNLSKPLFSTIVNGLVHEAEQSGYHIMLYHSNGSYTSEIKAVEMFQHRMIDGLIICSTNINKEGIHIKELQDHNIPVLTMKNIDPNLDANKIVFEYSAVAHTAVEHLITIGKKRLAFISSDTKSVEERMLNGFETAIAKYDLKMHQGFIKHLESSSSTDGYKTMTKIIATNKIPDGIFCTSPAIAMGVIRALKEANLRIPEQVAVISLADERTAEQYAPTLSLVSLPAFEMGTLAVDLIKEEIGLIKEDKMVTHKTYSLKPSLFIRESTGGNK